jgi:hypothetical protein
MIEPERLPDVRARHYSDAGYCYWCDAPYPCDAALVGQALDDLAQRATFAAMLRDRLTCAYADFRNLGTIRRSRKQFTRFFRASIRG